MRARLRLQDESGFALVVALGVTIVMTIFVVSVISYTTSNQRSAQLSSDDVQAVHYAEGALNGAFSILNHVNTNGTNATSPNLLGCAVGYSSPGISDCSNPTPKPSASPPTSCAAGTDGSGTVYGFFSGTNPQTLQRHLRSRLDLAAVRNRLCAQPEHKRRRRQAGDGAGQDQPAVPDPAAVASVWNHVFVTAPASSGCSLSFGGNSVTITTPHLRGRKPLPRLERKRRRDQGD